MRYFWLSSLALLPLNRYIEIDVSWGDEHLSSCRYSLICCDDDSGESCATHGCVGVQPGWDQVNAKAIACDPHYLFGSSLLCRPTRYFGFFLSCAFRLLYGSRFYVFRIDDSHTEHTVSFSSGVNKAMYYFNVFRLICLQQDLVTFWWEKTKKQTPPAFAC